MTSYGSGIIFGHMRHWHLVRLVVPGASGQSLCHPHTVSCTVGVEILDHTFSTKQYVRPKTGQELRMDDNTKTAGIQRSRYTACMANRKSQNTLLGRYRKVYSPQYNQWRDYLLLRRMKHTSLITS